MMKWQSPMRTRLKVGLIAALTLSTASLSAASLINVNTATVQELDNALPGIGATKAQNIVAYRDANGPFKSLEDLSNVLGIGPKILAAIRGMVTFEVKTNSAPTQNNSPTNTVIPQTYPPP